MFQVLANRTYRHLFAAQAIALLGTGLATVALGLLAFEIAGGSAGEVLGTALAIKMVAYIGIAPVAGAFVGRVPRRGLLIAMDLVRAGAALLLPFVDQVWEIYVLIFLLQSASATFTPTFQATIPDLLPEEQDYTRALSLSRLAYDLESLASPAIAAALLTLISFHWLFSGTALGFAASALLILTTRLPRHVSSETRSEGIYTRTTRGIRIYLRTPRLRGLFAVTLAAAAASAMVIVNTVVIVRGGLALGQSEVAWALAAFGGGSMLAAHMLPRLLETVPDRRIMLGAAAGLGIGLAALAAAQAVLSPPEFWPVLLAGWFVLGIFYSMTVTPSGRLLRRSAHSEDRPTLFAAHFALSHACWLIAYPLVGWLGASFGIEFALAGMAALAAVGTIIGAALWPAHDPEVVPHCHDDLAPEHPHLAKEHGAGGDHAFIIDDLHPSWPRQA